MNSIPFRYQGASIPGPIPGMKAIKPKQKRNPACLGITKDTFIFIEMGGMSSGGYIRKWRDKEGGEEGWIIRGSKKRPEYIVEPFFILLGLDREIKWSKDNMDSPGPNGDFKKGFIAGLRQAKRIVKEIEKGARVGSRDKIRARGRNEK